MSAGPAADVVDDEERGRTPRCTQAQPSLGPSAGQRNSVRSAPRLAAHPCRPRDRPLPVQLMRIKTGSPRPPPAREAARGAGARRTLFQRSCAFLTLASAPARSKGGTSEGGAGEREELAAAAMVWAVDDVAGAGQAAATCWRAFEPGSEGEDEKQARELSGESLSLLSGRQRDGLLRGQYGRRALEHAFLTPLCEQIDSLQRETKRTSFRRSSLLSPAASLASSRSSAPAERTAPTQAHHRRSAATGPSSGTTAASHDPARSPRRESRPSCAESCAVPRPPRRSQRAAPRRS